MYIKRMGEPITQKLLDALRSNLGGEITQAFISELRTHNGKFTNFPGFLLKLSRGKARAASAPRTVAEAAAAAYRCATCKSKVPGHGCLLVDGKFVPCECASPEYVAEMTANGTFS